MSSFTHLHVVQNNTEAHWREGHVVLLNMQLYEEVGSKAALLVNSMSFSKEGYGHTNN